MRCVVRPSRLRPLATLALILAVSVVSIGFGSTQARAIGYGLYFDYAFGDVHPEWYVTGGLQADTSRFGVGLTMDTALAKNRLFNYRLNVGYEHVNERIDDFVFAKYNGASIENVFGFGVYRSPRMRVWLGPTLRIAGSVLDYDSTAFGSFSPSTTYCCSTDVVRWALGGGLAFGVNVHTGDRGSAALTIGYQAAWVTVGFAGIEGGSISDSWENRVNFNFAYFFRSRGDRFEK